MTRRVTPNQPGGQACDACGQVSTCKSWTVWSDADMGWQGTGTVHLCRKCLLVAAEEIKGKRFVATMIHVLRDAGVEVKHNATYDDLMALHEAYGIPYPGEDADASAPQQPAASAGSEPSSPEEGTIGWWRDQLDAAGITWRPSMNRKVLKRRLALWAEAKNLGIDLPDGATNLDAEGIVAASRNAKAALAG